MSGMDAVKPEKPEMYRFHRDSLRAFVAAEGWMAEKI